MTNQEPMPEARLVTVMETTERALVPLACASLAQEGIEYSVQNVGLADQIFGHRSSMTVGETRSPIRVVVRSEDEARALEVLRDLTAGRAIVAAPTEPVQPVVAAPVMTTMASTHGTVELTDADTGRPLGRISEAQFAALSERLERESNQDVDYYLDEATIAMLEEAGVDRQLTLLLRQALGNRSFINVRWAKDTSDRSA